MGSLKSVVLLWVCEGWVRGGEYRYWGACEVSLVRHGVRILLGNKATGNGRGMLVTGERIVRVWWSEWDLWYFDPFLEVAGGIPEVILEQ